MDRYHITPGRRYRRITEPEAAELAELATVSGASWETAGAISGGQVTARIVTDDDELRPVCANTWRTATLPRPPRRPRAKGKRR